MIQLTVLEHGNNGEVFATAFFEQSDGTPIFAYQTVTNYSATYSLIVGNPNFLLAGVSNYLPYNKSGSTTSTSSIRRTSTGDSKRNVE